jgi:hypothetical protein
VGATHTTIAHVPLRVCCVAGAGAGGDVCVDGCGGRDERRGAAGVCEQVLLGGPAPVGGDRTPGQASLLFQHTCSHAARVQRMQQRQPPLLAEQQACTRAGMRLPSTHARPRRMLSMVQRLQGVLAPHLWQHVGSIVSALLLLPVLRNIAAVWLSAVPKAAAELAGSCFKHRFGCGVAAAAAAGDGARTHACTHARSSQQHHTCCSACTHWLAVLSTLLATGLLPQRHRAPPGARCCAAVVVLLPP